MRIQRDKPKSLPLVLPKGLVKVKHKQYKHVRSVIRFDISAKTLSLNLFYVTHLIATKRFPCAQNWTVSLSNRSTRIIFTGFMEYKSIYLKSCSKTPRVITMTLICLNFLSYCRVVPFSFLTCLVCALFVVSYLNQQQKHKVMPPKIKTIGTIK